MEERKHRVAKKHARPGIAHHRTDPGPHVLAKAVHDAFGAGRLLCPKGASRHALPSIGQDLLTLGAQTDPAAVCAGTIDADHDRNGPLFTQKAIASSSHHMTLTF
jgi:hypothetical protein